MPTLFAKENGCLVGEKCSAGYFVLNQCLIINSQLYWPDLLQLLRTQQLISSV